MTVILASDSFKGCLSSARVNKALADAIMLHDPAAKVIEVPMSDGGEGFLDAIRYSQPHFEAIPCEVHDPLGRPISTYYLFDGTTAVIESAMACGLNLMTATERNPLIASTYGVGELIVNAIQRRAKKIIISLGGSGTSDCGIGMLKALFSTFAHSQQRTIPHADSYPHADEGQHLLHTILSWATSFRRYITSHGIEVIAATDVTNPLYGETGAAKVFARQKGATDDMIIELDHRAESFSKEASEVMGIDCSHLAGAGAAGGLGYACMQFLGGSPKSGADLLLDMIDFSQMLSDTDLVITGEGCADSQTLFGKLPERVLRKAQQAGVKTWLIAGRVSDHEALLAAGFDHVESITPQDMPLEEAMRPEVAIENIKTTMSQL